MDRYSDIDTDIIIINREKEYKMHKIMLKNIPYFQPLITKNGNFKTDNIIEIDVDDEGWEVIVDFLYYKYNDGQNVEEFVLKYSEDKIVMCMFVLNNLGDVKYYKELGQWLNYNKLDINVLSDLYNFGLMKNEIIMAMGNNYSLIDIFKYQSIYQDIIKIISRILSHNTKLSLSESDKMNPGNIIDFINNLHITWDIRKILRNFLLGSLDVDKRKSLLSDLYDSFKKHIEYSGDSKYDYPPLQLCYYIIDNYPEFINITFLFAKRSYSRITLLLQNGILPLTISMEHSIRREITVINSLVSLLNDPSNNNALLSWFSIISYINTDKSDVILLLINDICGNIYFTSEIDENMKNIMTEYVKSLLSKLSLYGIHNFTSYIISLQPYFDISVHDFIQ